jgi:hypothetical protein
LEATVPLTRLARTFEQSSVVAIALVVSCSDVAMVDDFEDAALADHRMDAALTDRSEDAGSREGAMADEAGNLPIMLFNGRDLTGWDKYLGPAYGSTVPQGSADPSGVFSVVVTDNAPAIRISGEVWGALTSVAEFENYHLSLEFKWGSHAVWPPLTSKDSGVMYHSVGPFGAVQKGGGMLADPPGSGWFMTSMELQIADNDLGSYYSLGPIVVNGGVYSAPASAQHENAVGTWNLIEVFVFGNESVQLVNGHRVAHVQGAVLALNDDVRPLTRGKIQLESESMEIFFRAITLAPIDEIPPDLL